VTDFFHRKRANTIIVPQLLPHCGIVIAVSRQKMLNKSWDGILIGSTVRLEDNLIKNVIGKRTSAAQAIAGESSRSHCGNLGDSGKDDLNEC
jgi:hypothetical protein